MASLFKRKNRYWIAYYVEDQQVRRSLGTDNPRIAKARKRQIEYELSLGDLHLATKLKVTAVVAAFCQHLQVTRTFKSWKNDVSRLRVFFGPICDELKPRVGGPPPSNGKTRKQPHDKYAAVHVTAELLEDISPERINRFIADRVAKNAWAPKSVNAMRQVLNQLFNFAIKHYGFRSRDRRYPNPATAVDRMREPAPQIRFLTGKQIEQQLAVLDELTQLQAMVAMYIYAGLRREEALWLTHEDVDLDARLLRVRAKTVDGDSWQPKTKRNRAVPISNALFAVLSDFNRAVTCPWYFPSPRGKHWSPDNFSRDLRAINGEHNLDWTCLDFRHTFGSQLAQKGESLYKIATLMGNSPDICRRHYAALVPEQMHDTVEFADNENERSDMKGMLEQILTRLDRQAVEKVQEQLRLVE